MADEKAQGTTQAQAGVKTLEPGEFESLLKGQYKGEKTQEAVIGGVKTLAEWAMKYSTVVSDDALKSIEAIKAEIDRILTEEVNLIIHHPEFQKLEGAWRGLHHLVNNTETDEMLKIRVLNISKNDLGKTLRKFKGTAWDQSPIFKEVYESGYGVLGGEPYGALIGDYHFDNGPQDVELLGEMAKVAAAAHAPFLAGAAPTLFGFETWQELSNPRELAKIQGTPEYAAWRSLRDSDDAKYIGLAMPRFLSRLPYGAKTNPVEEFAFEEDTTGAAHDKYTWANSAYAMAVNVNQAFKLYGWCSRIRGVESGGTVEGLPVHTFPTDDGGVDMKCPTEIAITRSPQQGTRRSRPDAADPPQGTGRRDVHRRAVPAEAGGVRGSGRHLERASRGASAVPVRDLPLRALPQVHRARQDRLVQGARGHGDVAQQLDHAVRALQPRDGDRGGEGAPPAGRGRGEGRGGRGQPRLLQLDLLPAAALPARGADRLPAAGLAAAVREEVGRR